MVEHIKMDKQGRITIPAHIRNFLSLSENNDLEIDIQANQIVIRKRSSANITQIEQWYEKMLNTTIPINAIESSESKWYSEDYVKNKLGL